MSFSLRLKEQRERIGLSQAALAKDLNVSTGSIGMWESTDRIPPAKKLIQIADYFHVSTDYLLGRKTEFSFSTSKTLESSSKEQQLIRCFRELPESSQDLILGMVKSAADAEKRA